MLSNKRIFARSCRIIDEFADPAGFEFNIEAVVFYEVTETPGKTDGSAAGKMLFTYK